jgi:hypothetical protein
MPVSHSQPRSQRSATERGALQAARWLPLLAGVLVGSVAFLGLDHEGSARADEAPAPARTGDWVRTVSALDAAIDARLSEAGVKPAAPSDDAEFLRRVTLDLTGTIPGGEEAVAFAKDTAPDKRARKIEALLESPAYAEFWSHWWYRVLTGLTPGARPREGDEAKMLRGPVDEVFQGWLHEQVKGNVPYDRFASEIITATGRTNANGATGWYARWEGKPNELAGALSKTFLGVKIQCAQCHDHKYEATWKQKDFQGMAAFFLTTAPRPIPEYVEAYREAEKMRRERMGDMKGEGEGKKGEGKGGDGKPGAKRGAGEGDAKMREAFQNRYVMDVQDVDPRTLGYLQRAKGKKIPEQLEERAALAGITPKAWMGPTLSDLPGLTRRSLLARWVTSPENASFAQTAVNRYWGHLMGRGIIDPVDDFSPVNLPSHPDLLAFLGEDFRRNGYDMKRLLRILANSATYQRTSRWSAAAGAESASAESLPDPALFARAPVRPLNNEQLFQALVRARGSEALLERLDKQLRGQAYGRGANAAFAAFTFLFDDDEGVESDEFAGSIPQGLFLMNGRMLQSALQGLPGTTVARVLADETTDAGRARGLYLAAYGREPDSDERRAAVAYVHRSKDRDAGWQDLFWVLLNSAEFMSNH